MNHHREDLPHYARLVDQIDDRSVIPLRFFQPDVRRYVETRRGFEPARRHNNVDAATCRDRQPVWTSW